MAFTLYNWSCVSSSLNQGLVTAAISTPSSDTDTLQGSMNLFSYYSLDTVATISGANYFLPVIGQLKISDVIMVTGSDASTFLQVATISYPSDVSSGSVTVVAFTAVGSVNTANIVDLAVTTAKINNLAVTTGKLDNLSVTNGKIAANAVDSSKLDVSTIQYAVISMTAAEWNGMYVTPKQLIAAPGANLQIMVHRVMGFLDYNSAQFAGGGNIFAQYDTTTLGAGTAATAGLANTGINSAVVDSTFQLVGSQQVAASSTTVNKSVCLSNASAAFTTGNSTFKIAIWYSIGSFA